MTELYQARSETSETTEPAAGPEQETGEHNERTRDNPAPDGNRGREHGHAEMPAALSDEDQLPTRQDARAATWGQDPEYDDESDPGPQADGDLDTVADGDQLPSRQDARAATWGEDPEYYDEGQPGPQDDGNPDVLTAEGHALDSDQGGEEQAVADQAARATAPSDTSPTEPSDGETATPAEQAPGSNSERITELEADNAQLSKTVIEMQARLERLERGAQAEPSTVITGQERDTAQQDAIEAKNPQARGRHPPTDEALALVAAATGGVITTIADYVPFLHADVAGVAASAVAVGAATVTWLRARGEERHAHRSED
jgi:hypothetical protein